MKRIAVITGASSGMGRRFAETVDTFGRFDEIWVIARHEAALEGLRERVPFPVRPLALDLTDRSSFGTYVKALAEEPEGCRRRIMRTGSWRRFLSVPTGNRSAAIRRETPWVRERPKPGVQAARATGLAVGRGQTDQAGRRMWDGPGHREQPGRTEKPAGEQKRQIPAPAQRKSIF